MDITMEISMYPLRKDYEEQVLRFLELLHDNEELTVKVNAMSTQISGDIDTVNKRVNAAIKKVYKKGIKACFVIKILPGELDLGYAYKP